MGMLFGKEANLKDDWNWVDLIVVIASILEKYVSALSGFRVFRLIRPLRILKHLKPMQLLLETFFQSTQSLGGILGLAIFFFQSSQFSVSLSGAVSPTIDADIRSSRSNAIGYLYRMNFDYVSMARENVQSAPLIDPNSA